jgi:hypothetical protein
MGRKRKWRWKEVIPYSACTCFGRKEWEAIVEEEEAEGSPVSIIIIKQQIISEIIVPHSVTSQSDV